MNRLEMLEEKVKTAAGEIVSLREQCRKLQAQVQFLEEENKRLSDLINSNVDWNEEKRSVVTHIERVLRKLNTLKI